MSPRLLPVIAIATDQSIVARAYNVSYRRVSVNGTATNPPPPADKRPQVITPFFAAAIRGSGPRLVGRIGSEVRVSASFKKIFRRRILSYDSKGVAT